MSPPRPVEGSGFAYANEWIRTAFSFWCAGLDNRHNLLFDNAAGDYFGLATPGPGAVSADPRFLGPAAGGLGGGSDLGGDPRFQDGDRNGVATVDIGAFEAPPFDGVQAIPTLSTWALVLLAGLLTVFAARRLRRPLS